MVSMLRASSTSCVTPPILSTCSLIIEKSSTMLQIVALAICCTSADGSRSRRSIGAATSASISAERCIFTVRLRLRTQRQAASRTPASWLSSARTICPRTLASISCLRLSSRSMHSVPSASSVPSSSAQLHVSSCSSRASLLMASASAASRCSASLPSTSWLSTRGTSSRTSASPSSFIRMGSSVARSEVRLPAYSGPSASVLGGQLRAKCTSRWTAASRMRGRCSLAARSVSSTTRGLLCTSSWQCAGLSRTMATSACIAASRALQRGASSMGTSSSSPHAATAADCCSLDTQQRSRMRAATSAVTFPGSFSSATSEYSASGSKMRSRGASWFWYTIFRARMPASTTFSSWWDSAVWMRCCMAPLSSTAITPASSPYAKLPRVAALCTSNALLVLLARMSATLGTAPSRTYTAFLVRLPITWFFTSRSALRRTSSSGEDSASTADASAALQPPPPPLLLLAISAQRGMLLLR
mmetsp:Transcript_4156/g.10526  ORF Transcript_4156/g.10526 Transcript_4156/m.10526 type:complete len:473 (+) Transcript_4156:713-2131(+)